MFCNVLEGDTMKLWNDIKDQFNWYKKYRKSLQQRLFNQEADVEAAKHAIQVLAKYEALTASLPVDHELSTQVYWKDYADKNLMRDNENLRSQLKHLREVYCELSNKWTDNILRYGVQMYGKWQPIEIVPDDTEVIVTDGANVCLASKRNGVWISAGLPFADTVTHWMALPEFPK